jgi:type I restriction enzyme S subunit
MKIVHKDKVADNEIPIGDLPKGWVLSRINDLIEINYGKGLKESDRKPGAIPVYGSNGIVGSHNIALTEGSSIIIGRKGSVGAVHYSSTACWPIDTTYYVDKFNGLNHRFVMYALRLLDLCALDTSTAIPGLNRNDIYAQKMPLPPVDEQKRIVTKVEELLVQVNAAKDRLAKVSMILRRFRQAVLAAACSGHLTADWRNKELHSNSSNQPLDGNEDLPSSWSWRSIRDLASSKKGSIQSGPFGSNLLHSEFQPTGILVIGIDNILDGKFSFGKQHRITHQKYELLKKYAARPLDVLVTVMATVGRCCVVPSDIETAIITKHVYRITADHTVVNPYYLMQCIRGCPAVLAQVQSEIQGVTRPGINGAILKQINIPLPPVSEQHEIVRRVEALFKLADAVEKRLAVATARAEKLTQAILAKALRGELVPTEAELARREGRSYETASELLARIKLEPQTGKTLTLGHSRRAQKRQTK